MTPTIYRYRFGRNVPPRDVEECLLLAVLAAEGLHGTARVEMDAACRIDKDTGHCVIDATTEVGRDITRIFTGFLIHEFGRETFAIDALESTNYGAGRHAMAVPLIWTHIFARTTQPPFDSDYEKRCVRGAKINLANFIASSS